MTRATDWTSPRRLPRLWTGGRDLIESLIADDFLFYSRSIRAPTTPAAANLAVIPFCPFVKTCVLRPEYV